MEKIELRVLIKHYVLGGKSIKETIDAERPGRPKEVTSQSSWKCKHFSGTRMAHFTWMFGHEEAVCKMGAAFAHSWSQAGSCGNSKGFLRRHVTVDETWIHYYTPETNNQSKMGTGPGESAPKKAKTISSAGKVMPRIFWDSHGIILIDYLQKEKTITGEYYASLLDRFDAILKEKRPHLAKKSAFPPRHCTSSHGQIIWFTLQNTSSSTLFSKFGFFCYKKCFSFQSYGLIERLS